MTTDDFLVFSVSRQLGYSKSRSYRDQTLSLFTVLCRFLQKNGLVNVNLVDDEQEVSDDLEVRRRDLTDEGFEFYKRAEQKWLSAIDRGTPPTDTSILERELAKIRDTEGV